MYDPTLIKLTHERVVDGILFLGGLLLVPLLLQLWTSSYSRDIRTGVLDRPISIFVNYFFFGRWGKWKTLQEGDLIVNVSLFIFGLLSAAKAIHPISAGEPLPTPPGSFASRSTDFPCRRGYWTCKWHDTYIYTHTGIRGPTTLSPGTPIFFSLDHSTPGSWSFPRKKSRRSGLNPGPRAR